jgi:hypothetical protein
MTTTTLTTGREYRVSSVRKGKFTGKLTHADDTWATFEITAGKADAMLRENVREKGEEVTVRRDWCAFTEVLTHRVRTSCDKFQVKHMGRWFNVVARFPDTKEGTKESNDYMIANPNTGLLTIADGWINIADMDDAGVAA